MLNVFLEFLSKKIITPLHRRMVSTRRIRVISEQLIKSLEAADYCCGSGLDVGCGDGRIARFLQENIPGIQMKGVDISRREDVCIPVESFDGRTIPFADNQFDLVILVHVLHHIEEPAELLRECARVAKHAIFIVDHLCENKWDHLRLSFMDWVGNRGYDVPLPYNYLSRRTWDHMFSELNMKKVSEREGLGLYPFPFNYLFDRKIQVAFHLKLNKAEVEYG